jgi:hypothetical protein
MPGLVFELHADYSGGPEELKADVPGEPGVSRPAPPGTWPLAGVTIANLELPQRTTLSTRRVVAGIREGWIVGEGERIVTRPSGPPGAKWFGQEPNHTFAHYDTLVFKTLNHGDVRYKVVRQPDKYADYGAATFPDRVQEFDADEETPVTDEIYNAGATRVHNDYRLELEEPSDG